MLGRFVVVAALIAGDRLTPLNATAAALSAFAIRMLALRYGWRAPRAWHRNDSRTSEE